MSQSMDDPKKHAFLAEGPPGSSDAVECQVCGFPKSDHYMDFKELISVIPPDEDSALINTPDPRGDGPIQDKTNSLGDDGQGQNIIDNMNSEPILFSMGENSSHDYPGKIVVNNEPERALATNDFQVKKNTIPGPAATGAYAPGSDVTQPTLPTGAPSKNNSIKNNKHGNNFNDDLNQDIKINPMSETEFNEQDHPRAPEGSENGGQFVAKDSDVPQGKTPGDKKAREKFFAPYADDESLKETVAERVSLKHELPSSGFYDSVESPLTTDVASEGLHDTGLDLSRTGPGGNNPKDNYDAENYQGQGNVKLNIPTPYYSKDAKKIYDISGTPPELQEDIRILISDPAGDETFMPEIKIDIAGHLEAPGNDNVKILAPGNLKNNPGRKDSGTHINTIPAGEDSIEDLIPISDIWKEKNNGLGPYSEFEFSETVQSPERFFEHPSSWVGQVRYFPQAQKMAIKMNGKTYMHCGVTDKDFDSFEGSPSKGEHWNRIFKNRMQCSQGLSEALTVYRHKQPDEFNWINDEEIQRMLDYSKEHGKGRFILAVVSGESVTDHRPEGAEQHRRRWNKQEMMQNIRTAKGKLIDINHMYSKIDPHSGGIYDANWNFETQRGEMMIWETDQKILDAIRNDVITAVSINTGKPRRINTNCADGECFIEPEGTILGEGNGVALAYVVTHPDGFNYHGQHIPSLPPGMKFTKIYLVE